MRKYKYIDQYLNELLEDVYEQPEDEGHTKWANDVITKWVSKLKCQSVLDVGCGEAFTQPTFELLGIVYLGVCLGKDYVEAKKKGRQVEQEDFNFLPYVNLSFDLIFARHSLEHSPMPLLTLFEWHRVAKNWLCLILPKPKYWKFGGRNHYGVMVCEKARHLLERAGWKIMWEDHDTEEEYRFMCEKVERVMIYIDDLDFIDKDDEE